MNEQLYTVIDSPVGSLMLTGNGRALTELSMSRPDAALCPKRGWTRSDDDRLLVEAARQLAEYFGGRRREFDLPLAATGTEFQRRVWAELVRIPYGRTISYAELASRIGSPNACRAVGLANARNPIGIIVPCHRVIGASGALTGFAAGLDNKRVLLELERRHSAASGAESQVALRFD